VRQSTVANVREALLAAGGESLQLASDWTPGTVCTIEENITKKILDNEGAPPCT
jgi:hypothetical protein